MERYPSTGEQNMEGGKECGIEYRRDNPDRGVLLGIEKLPSQAKEHRVMPAGNPDLQRLVSQRVQPSSTSHWRTFAKVSR